MQPIHVAGTILSQRRGAVLTEGPHASKGQTLLAGHLTVNLRDVWICGFPRTHILHYISGYHKQYIQVDMTCNIYVTTLFILDLQRHGFITIIQMHLSGAGVARTVYFPNCLKECFWKSIMQHVVKSNVYLDTLLMVSIYVINLWILERKPTHPQFS